MKNPYYMIISQIFFGYMTLLGNPDQLKNILFLWKNLSCAALSHFFLCFVLIRWLIQDARDVVKRKLLNLLSDM